MKENEFHEFSRYLFRYYSFLDLNRKLYDTRHIEIELCDKLRYISLRITKIHFAPLTFGSIVSGKTITNPVASLVFLLTILYVCFTARFLMNRSNV